MENPGKNLQCYNRYYTRFTYHESTLNTSAISLSSCDRNDRIGFPKLVIAALTGKNHIPDSTTKSLKQIPGTIIRCRQGQIRGFCACDVAIVSSRWRKHNVYVKDMMNEWDTGKDRLDRL